MALTAEEAAALREVAQKLVVIAGGLDGQGELPLDHPPGTFKVVPTGPLGQGKVRIYPSPIEVNRMDGTRGMELCWAYALRLTYLKDEAGEPLVPPIFRQQIGSWMQKMAPPPEQWRMYAAYVDHWVHPEDWMTQPEIDEKLRSDAQWAEDYRRKYGI